MRMIFESCANVARRCESCGEAASRSNGGEAAGMCCSLPGALKAGDASVPGDFSEGS